MAVQATATRKNDGQAGEQVAEWRGHGGLRWRAAVPPSVLRQALASVSDKPPRTCSDVAAIAEVLRLVIRRLANLADGRGPGTLRTRVIRSNEGSACPGRGGEPARETISDQRGEPLDEAPALEAQRRREKSTKIRASSRDRGCGARCRRRSNSTSRWKLHADRRLSSSPRFYDAIFDWTVKRIGNDFYTPWINGIPAFPARRASRHRPPVRHRGWRSPAVPGSDDDRMATVIDAATTMPSFVPSYPARRTSSRGEGVRSGHQAPSCSSACRRPASRALVCWCSDLASRCRPGRARRRHGPVGQPGISSGRPTQAISNGSCSRRTRPWPASKDRDAL